MQTRLCLHFRQSFEKSNNYFFNMDTITIKEELTQNLQETNVSNNQLGPSVYIVNDQQQNENIRLKPIDSLCNKERNVIEIPPIADSEVDYRRKDEDNFYPEYDLYDSEIGFSNDRDLKAYLKEQKFSESDCKFISTKRKALQKRWLRNKCKKTQ